jgi:GWxTD domain-containing protein
MLAHRSGSSSKNQPLDKLGGGSFIPPPLAFAGVVILSRMRHSVVFLLFCTLFAPCFPAFASNSVKSLPANYRHWIEVEVPYIISGTERKQFLALTTDEARDSFIDAFWRVRNPDPSSDTNGYKEEHYRRLAYANEHFGNAKYEDGWRTEMGRIYIILGPPKQRAPYHEKPNLRAMEVWFYEGGGTPALPPYFYIVFYKPSPGEAYRIYSPTQDGPARLVTTGRADNTNQQAIEFIRKSVGDEVAKTTMTLIPGEIADFDHPEPSMASDSLLATINDLPDNPVTKERLEANRLREHVTTSILIGDQSTSLGYAVYRDDQGRLTLSYLLSSALPDARIIGTRPDGGQYYDLSLRTSILTPEGKSVYDQEDLLKGDLTNPQAETAKKRRFGAEARLPLAPGTYKLIATLTNNVNHVATRQQAMVTVPTIKADGAGISELLQFTPPNAVPDAANQLPFSMSKLRFTPRGAQSAYVRAGDKLPLVFQLWLDPKADGAAAEEKVHLHYVFGAVTASHESAHEENEDIDASNRDKAGNLVTGHTLNTSELTVGTYRMVVSATRDGSKQPSYAAMTIHVQRVADYNDSWTAYGAVERGGVALDDFKRGLSADAQGKDAMAQELYARALAEGSADTRPLEKLAAVLQRRGKNQDLAALSQQPLLAGTAVAPNALLAISDALTKQGDPKGVVRMLEAQIKLQPPSAALYRALADASEATGNAARARDLRSLAAGVN